MLQKVSRMRGRSRKVWGASALTSHHSTNGEGREHSGEPMELRGGFLRRPNKTAREHDREKGNKTVPRTSSSSCHSPKHPIVLVWIKVNNTVAKVQQFHICITYNNKHNKKPWRMKTQPLLSMRSRSTSPPSSLTPSAATPSRNTSPKGQTAQSLSRVREVLLTQHVTRLLTC